MGELCEFCQATATDEHPDRDGRVMSVCDRCKEELWRADERQRREDDADYAADQKLSEWKDEGRR
jgi:ribosome-binding protein aMBF1 (putative translation factor)